MLSSSGPYNTFVAKWSPGSGSFVWVQQGITPSSGYSAASAVAVQGTSIYVAGYFEGAALTFGSVSLANAGTQYRDMYVLKLSDMGATANVRWGWRAGGSGPDEALAGGGDAGVLLPLPAVVFMPVILAGGTIGKTNVATDTLSAGYGRARDEKLVLLRGAKLLHCVKTNVS